MDQKGCIATALYKKVGVRNSSTKDDKEDDATSSNKDEKETHSEETLRPDQHEEESGDDDEEEDEEERGGFLRMLQDMFQRKLGLSESEEEKPEKLLDELSLDGIVRYIQSAKCENIIAMVGAGISTAAGIPDFRSPGSGLYANLQKYNLPTPECMFDISYFRDNPTPFFALARQLYPQKFKPTMSHYFLRLLHEKGLLLRLYTQNIDTLERVAGLPGEKVVEAHGTFYTSHCINGLCRKEYDMEWMKAKIFSDGIPTCTKCNSTVKPDIVFFGERLPERFFQCAVEDFPKCDLLIIIGTSLTVQPFAGLVDQVAVTTPRLMINKEKCPQAHPLAVLMGSGSGLNFDNMTSYRDVAWLGTCDDGCQALADALGWGDELKNVVTTEHARIEEEFANEN